jgi:PAS domain S-box-containing protein
MRSWPAQPLKTKVTLIVLATSATALGLACAILIVVNQITMKQHLVREMTVRAKLIASNGASAVTFNDRDAGTEILGHLNALPRIAGAAIYAHDGSLFADYVRAGFTEAVPRTPVADGHRFGDDHLDILVPINLDGVRIGSVYLRSDLVELRDQVRLTVVFLASATAMALLAAFLLALRLQRSVSEPIVKLTDVARRVSEAGDYSTRAPKVTEDEIGMLADTFNHMLRQIQTRDEELRNHREHLEQLVRARTEAWETANARLKVEIAERGHAQRHLEQSRALLQSFVEHTPAAVAMFDRNLVYVAASKRWLHDYRIGDRNIIGQHHYDVFPEIRQNKDWQAVHQRCLAGAIERREEDPFVRQDGTTDWLRWEVGPWHDPKGAKGGIIMFTEVITARKMIEEALRESEKRFRAIFNRAPYGIAIIDSLSGSFKHVNQKYCDITGYTQQEMLERTFQAITHPNDLQADLNNMQSLIEGRIGIFQIDKRYFRKDGEIVWVQLTCVPLWLEEADPRLHIAMVEDITVRKRAEEALRTSLAEKDVLLKEVHHRVKNNLQVIASLLNLQRSLCQDDRAREVLRNSQDRVRAMALVHETLYQSPDLAHVSAADYVHRLTEHLRHSYAGTSDRISLTVQAEPLPLPPEVMVPCGLLLNELLSNCLKHAFPDGRRGEIRVRLAVEPDHGFTLIVHDNGVGLPVTIDPTRSTSLGLQLVGQLVAQMGGTVSVDRAQGTAWTIRSKPGTSEFVQAR